MAKAKGDAVAELVDAETGELVPVDAGGNLPVVVEVDPFEDAFAGSENVTGRDIIIPRLKLAQAMTPELKKQRPEYLAGLEEGDLFETATRRFWKGMDGVLLVPCYFTKRYLEWAPRSGADGKNNAPVAEHQEDILKSTKEDDKGRPVLPNGNRIAVTPEFYCLLVDGERWDRVVVGMPGTKAKVSRQWNTLIKTRVMQHPQKQVMVQMASFWGAYRMRSVATSNNEGDFFIPSMTFEGPVESLPHGKQIYMEARAFYNDAKDGIAKPASDAEDDGEGGGGQNRSAQRGNGVGGSMPF